MNPPILVFAGSALEARKWARAEGLEAREWSYVAGMHHLRGRRTRHQRREFLAGFLPRRDADDLLAALAVADAV